MYRLVVLFAAIIMGALAAVGSGFEARAQSDDRFPHLWNQRSGGGGGQQNWGTFRWPWQDNRVRERRRVPSDQAGRPPRAAPAAPRVVAPTAPVAPAQPAVEPTTFVLVLGDNIGEWLAYGLEDAFEDIPEIGINDQTKVASGLVRTEFHDWPRAIPEVLARETRVDFIVFQVGSNDRQTIRIDREQVEPRTSRWREIYIQRVDATIAALKARGVPVYWVGMPPLRGARLSADMAYLNEIYKERAEKAGITYVDVWNGFVDEQGQYAQFGPDFAGQIRRLRTADGVHFTDAGARKLALFLEQPLRRDLVGRLSPGVPALPQPAQPERAPDQPPPGPEAALPAGPAQPPPRPLAGPIIPLAGNPTLPGGATIQPTSLGGLAGERVVPRALDGPAAAVILRGEEPPPAAGRADDFRWPRPLTPPR